jgi:7-cyano-7-deazaguanine synthase
MDFLEPPAAIGVLTSGGLDSAILLGETLRHHAAVQPIYVRQGLLWEGAELDHLDRFLDALRQPALRPLVVLDLPVADVYGDHWSLHGRGAPGAETADEAVYLPGRNVLLLAKSLLWCHLHGITTLALATLRGNPFPDATPEFFSSYTEMINRAVGGAVRTRRPFEAMSKADAMRLGHGLPLELTLSCLRPVAGRHCGACNKCAERRRAFAAVGREDPTDYCEESAEC